MENYSSWQLIKDLLSFLRPYRRKFWTGIFLRFTSDIAWLYPAYALSSLVTLFSHPSQPGVMMEFWKILGLWISLSIYHYVVHDGCKYLVFQASERCLLDAQTQALRHLASLDIAWHERENSGNKLKRIQRGGDGIDTIIRMAVNNLVEIAVNFGGMIFILFFLDPLIAGIILVFLVIYLFLGIRLTRKAAIASQIVNVQEEEVQGLTFEIANNIQTVKVLGMQNALMKILMRLVDTLFRKVRYRIYRFRLRSGILNICGQVFRLAVVGTAIWGILNGRYEVGFLVLVYGYFDKIWQSVSELSDVTNDFVIAKYGIQRLMDIFHEPIRIESEKGKSDFPKTWEKIRVENLSFAYGENRVLHDLSFSIRRGEKIGIVGLSGGGKSTLFKLFLKQREEYSGNIFFGEESLKKIKKSSYLKHVAVVLQETELFNMSLKDNILIAAPEEKFDPKRFEQVLEISHVHDFLPKLPQGVDTLIGEKGVKLSGGEKQRLGIARAAFRNPDILFLDEATSHLDVESERKIQDSLHQFFADITAVVIAHRLSTIREMDRILVLEQGHLVESGSFSTLMKKKGRFHELWNKQQFLE